MTRVVFDFGNLSNSNLRYLEVLYKMSALCIIMIKIKVHCAH